MLPQHFLEILKKQKYKLAGEHSAVKLCHWTKQSLLNNRFCYKQKFYGIQSHRCLQMTPTVGWCQQRCVFCWRPHEFNIPMPEQWDEPEVIVEQSIIAQRKLLEGYYGLLDRVDKNKLDEAMNPNQVAISLAGEPTIYPYISDLIAAYESHGFTTFLVTNGLLPETIENMHLPTQLYMSLDAPNEEIHKKVNIPLVNDSWARINKTLELFPSLDTRRVIRITLVKGWNDVFPEQYAKLVEKSEVDFLEVKAFMLVGYSRKRLRIENMPLHEEVLSFAKQIEEHLPGYKIIDEKKDSRVVLLSNGKKNTKIK
ncbi:MAG: 4-demethylwyosine synthase TYW1 [Candidatus Diapherotrites archaeon]|nr:4-demethylwyosine synthase TYW1 [Candidatus Diapherotrites archaeon]